MKIGLRLRYHFELKPLQKCRSLASDLTLSMVSFRVVGMVTVTVAGAGAIMVRVRIAVMVGHAK